MELVVDRTNITNNYTEGKLYINGEYFCDTLENPDRGLYQGMSSSQIKSIKVPKETAIPTGTYNVNLNINSSYSDKSNRRWYKNTAMRGIMPRIMNVPGFEGILIHYGTSSAWTEGCLLVGSKSSEGRLKADKSTIYTLYGLLARAKSDKEKVTITIKDSDGLPITYNDYSNVEYNNANINFGVSYEETLDESTRETRTKQRKSLQDTIKELGNSEEPTEESTEEILSNTTEESTTEILSNISINTSKVSSKSNMDLLDLTSSIELPGLDSDSIIDNILNNRPSYLETISLYDTEISNIDKQESENKRLKEELGDNYTETSGSLFTKETLQQLKESTINQYRESLRGEINPTIAKIKISYLNIVDGIMNLKDAITNFLSGQVIPSTLVTGTATGTPNPAYSALQLKVFKSQISSILSTMNNNAIDVAKCSDEIKYTLPDSVLKVFESLNTLSTTIKSL